MTVTVQCRSFEESEKLRIHLLTFSSFFDSSVNNPVALRIGDRVDITVKNRDQEVGVSCYCQGWLAGRGCSR